MCDNERREKVDHQAIAWKCQLEPGREFPVGVYRIRVDAARAARDIRAGANPIYRPVGFYEASAHPHARGTAVWVRYVEAGEPVPLPVSMTVRVPNYGTQRGYEGVRISEVTISARCASCGGPRGETVLHHFVRDGRRLSCDRWTNLCGHEDMYDAVLAEARVFAEQAAKSARRGPRIQSPGGEFAQAVAILADAVGANPWMSAQSGIELLLKRGQGSAADAVRGFNDRNHGTPSARSAALFLADCDARMLAAKAANTTTGDTK